MTKTATRLTATNPLDIRLLKDFAERYNEPGSSSKNKEFYANKIMLMMDAVIERLEATGEPL